MIRKWHRVMMVMLTLALAAVLPGGVLRSASAAVNDLPVREAVAQPANTVTWSAEFFDNNYLMGEPKFKTTFTGLHLYWGSSSPNSAIPVDNFSARLGADPYFAAGTYRFFVQADDEVKVKVGSVPWLPEQINTFDDTSKVGQRLSFDLALEAGVHHIQIDYRERTSEAYVYFEWINLAGGAAAPSFPIPVRVNLANPWTVQYFNNPALSGAPVLAQTEAQGPNANWGDAAPAGGVPADNFSARYVSFQRLDPGTYEIVAQADDGIRVLLNGQLLINEWHGASGATYTARFAHAGGDVTFTVEYYDATGPAFVSFRVGVPADVAAASSTPASSAVSTGTTATVLAWRLNVRDAPNTTGNILTRIDRNQTYPVVGAIPDQSWWQINVNGTIGWVSARWVRITTNATAAPIVPTVAPTATPAVLQAPVATGYFVTAFENVNIRAFPNSSAAIVGLLPYQQQAGIVGRTATNSWWQVRYGVVTGWVISTYGNVQPGINLAAIPVTG